MIVKKAGTILINLANKKIGLVYRENKNDYSFPKGHLEEGETLQECAVRETEEETGRKNHLVNEEVKSILRYNNSIEDVKCYFYLAIDDGESDNIIPEELKEKLVWVSSEEVKDKLTYDNLKQIWQEVEENVNNILNNITPSNLTDLGVCPTCFNKENNNCLYGDNKDKILYEDTGKITEIRELLSI